MEVDSRIRADGELRAEIRSIPEDRRASALARLVSQKLGQRLSTLKPSEQVRLVNGLLSHLDEADTLLASPSKHEPQELLSISRGDQRYTDRPPIPLSDSALITNGRAEPALARVLEQELKTADRVDLLCAFVKWSGLRLLDEAFRDLQTRGIPFRILTTTYMGATERGALERLAREYGADIKINYDTAGTRLHAKSWLIYRNSGFSTAFVGSSNLSRAAMLDGLEWNVRVSAASAPALFGKLAQTFDAYWEGAAFETYDPTRDSVRLQRSLKIAGSSQGDILSLDTSFLDVEPQPHQRIMLADLAHERAAGRHRNLVVAATGTGKTVLAALDYRRLTAGKKDDLSVLFVAHRREILQQAQATFRQVLHSGTFGELLVNGHQPVQWRHVLASVQSLNERMLNTFAPKQFDVVVIDEFHHAEAPSYQRIIDYLHPQELLGLTATPERADGVDVALKFFDGRIASELRLWDALEGDLLVPFHYFAIADNTDLRGVTFTRGAYDTHELEHIYVDEDRRSAIIVEAIKKRILDPTSMRALAFCVSVRHAEHMAQILTRAGISSVALSGGSTDERRLAALEDLRAGRLACICTVDLFNEGLDIPSIDTVLMLRPTQSATIFLQQLGRGLRRSYGKSVLTVLDFVGMQQRGFSFERKYRALTGLGHRKLAEALESGFPALPPGCDLVFDEVAQKVVLENLRSELRLNTPGLASEIRSYALDSPNPHGYTLTRFLVESDREMSQVLGRGKIHGHAVDWTRLQYLAGLTTDLDESEEAEYLRSRIRVFAHVDDPERERLYATLAATDGPAYDDLEPAQQVAADMLFYNVWPDRGDLQSVQAGLDILRRHPWFAEEIAEVMAFAVARSRAVFAAPGGRLAATPLQVHATYRKDELLAAIGIGHNFSEPRTPGQIREGVAYSRELGVDALMVQLQKTDAQFSEATMYQDYAISESLFHWQTQNSTSPESPVGRRYTGQSDSDSDIALFARVNNSDDYGKGAPYTFLGLANFLQASGSKPMSITWELRNPMPPELYLEARAVGS